MSSTYDRWIKLKRPFYSSLPGINRGYYWEEGGNVTDWITKPFDDKLLATKALVDDLPRQLNPMTCDTEFLEFIAQLMGFSDGYWRSEWKEHQKRKLLSRALNFVWRYKGSIEVLQWLLEIFDIDATVESYGGLFYADLTLTDTPIEGNGFTYFVIVKPVYERNSEEFIQARWLINKFTPVWTEVILGYDQFYTDLSLTDGEPIGS